MKRVVATRLVFAVRKVSLRSTSLKSNSLFSLAGLGMCFGIPSHTYHPQHPGKFYSSFRLLHHVAFPRRGRLQVRHFLCFLKPPPFPPHPPPPAPACHTSLFIFLVPLHTENSWRAGTILDYEPWNPRAARRMLSHPGQNHKAGSRLSKV